MTRSTQIKTIALLEDIAKAHDVEVIDNHIYSNQGHLRFESKYALRAVLDIKYSFNIDYATFELTPPITGQQGKLHYVKFDELDSRLIAPVEAWFDAEVLAR